MTATVPVPTKNPGDVLTSALWNTYVAGNVNKLLNQGHRVLTVAQFGALTGLEDGDEVYLEVDATNGIQWHLRYHLATTKWRFLGGPELWSEVVTTEGSSSTTYVALTTAGPSITLPLAGDYDVEIGFTQHDASAGGVALMSYDIGGTGALDADAVQQGSGVNTATYDSGSRARRKTGLTAVALTAKYRTTGGNVGASNRWMRVRPARIG